jgi:hypothetical protein
MSMQIGADGVACNAPEVFSRKVWQENLSPNLCKKEIEFVSIIQDETGARRREN